MRWFHILAPVDGTAARGRRCSNVSSTTTPFAPSATQISIADVSANGVCLCRPAHSCLTAVLDVAACSALARLLAKNKTLTLLVTSETNVRSLVLVTTSAWFRLQGARCRATVGVADGGTQPHVDCSRDSRLRRFVGCALLLFLKRGLSFRIREHRRTKQGLFVTID